MIFHARRQWWRLVAAGAALLPGLARSQSKHGTAKEQPVATSQRDPKTAARRPFFTDADRAFISAAVDRFIPRDNFASASEAGVVDYIERQLSGAFGAGQHMYLEAPRSNGTPQQGYQLALAPAQVYRRALDALVRDREGRQFARLSAEQQDTFLKRLEASELDLNGVPSAIFFETLLANTIEGYFADPIYGGNRDMVSWRMVGFPGAYARFADWVDKHNLPFNRPPLSIAQTSAQHSTNHSTHR